MTTHSSVLAWRIPGTGEPGRLPSLGSQRVRHDWSDLAAACLFNLYAQYIIWNAGLDKSQAGIKIARRNDNNLRYTDVTLMAESKEELKSLLVRMKEENEKVGLKLSIQKTDIIVSSPITSWQIEGEKVETVTDFISLDSKITVNNDCSHESKRHLLLGRKTMRNLGSILQIRDIILPTKVCIAKAIIFPVVMYVSDSRTIKKAECRRIDAVKLWCWRRLLRVPWTARSNQSILKEINLELFIKTENWSWSSNTLATWCKELIHWKKPWCWERRTVKGEGAAEDEMARWHHWLSGHEFEQTLDDRGAWPT